jgi:hypothetical protein
MNSRSVLLAIFLSTVCVNVSAQTADLSIGMVYSVIPGSGN